MAGAARGAAPAFCRPHPGDDARPCVPDRKPPRIDGDRGCWQAGNRGLPQPSTCRSSVRSFGPAVTCAVRCSVRPGLGMTSDGSSVLPDLGSPDRWRLRVLANGQSWAAAAVHLPFLGWILRPCRHLRSPMFRSTGPQDDIRWVQCFAGSGITRSRGARGELISGAGFPRSPCGSPRPPRDAVDVDPRLHLPFHAGSRILPSPVN